MKARLVEFFSDDRIAGFFQRVSIGRLAAVKVAILCWCVSTFVASPSLFLWSWKSVTEKSRAHDYLALCVDPLSRNLNEPIVSYRLTVPLIAWALHLPPVAALALPYLGHLAFLALVYLAMRRKAEPSVAILTTLMVALSFALFWSNWNPGITDTTSHLLAASLLLTVSGRWVIVAIFFGLLNDERMCLALPFVALWHFPPVGTSIRVWLGQSKHWFAAAAGALACYVLARHALTVGWIGSGIAKPETYDGIQSYVQQLRPQSGSWLIWAVNVFMSFRWAWLFVGAFAAAMWIRGNRLLAVIFTAALVAGSLASAVVADVSRSIGFMFPAWLMAICGLAMLDRERLERVLRLTVVALLLTPVFFTFEDFHLKWMRPLPLVVARCFVGQTR